MCSYEPSCVRGNELRVELGDADQSDRLRFAQTCPGHAVQAFDALYRLMMRSDGLQLTVRRDSSDLPDESATILVRPSWSVDWVLRELDQGRTSLDGVAGYLGVAPRIVEQLLAGRKRRRNRPFRSESVS